MSRRVKKEGAERADRGRIADSIGHLAMPIEDFVPDPRNARKHGEENLEAIRGSLEEFGQVKPLVVRAADKRVICGNGTLLAAKQLGWTSLAAVVLDVTEERANQLAIADNRTAELAEWDNEILLELLEETNLEGLSENFLAMLEGLQGDYEPPEEEEPKEIPGGTEDKYLVIITCKNEEEQLKLLERFQADNLDCRAMFR